MDTPTALFAYGSLADPESAALTLGRPVPRSHAAELVGWRRRFSQARDNRAAEKTFATPEGEIPARVLGLNVEPAAPGDAVPNGVLIEVDETELARLDGRELRYDRVEVTESISVPGGLPAGIRRVVTYVAKPAHYAPRTPPGAVIIAAYAKTIERAFARLSAEAAQRYRASTLPYPAPLVEGILVADRIPPGNPRRW
jgi:cation transport regulator ChaC